AASRRTTSHYQCNKISSLTGVKNPGTSRRNGLSYLVTTTSSSFSPRAAAFCATHYGPRWRAPARCSTEPGGVFFLSRKPRCGDLIERGSPIFRQKPWAGEPIADLPGEGRRAVHPY